MKLALIVCSRPLCPTPPTSPSSPVVQVCFLDRNQFFLGLAVCFPSYLSTLRTGAVTNYAPCELDTVNSVRLVVSACLLTVPRPPASGAPVASSGRSPEVTACSLPRRGVPGDSPGRWEASWGELPFVKPPLGHCVRTILFHPCA